MPRVVGRDTHRLNKHQVHVHVFHLGCGRVSAALRGPRCVRFETFFLPLSLLDGTQYKGDHHMVAVGRRYHWESTAFAALCVALLAMAAILTTNKPVLGVEPSVRRSAYALLAVALVAAWVTIARSATATQLRMAALSVYTLGDGDPCCNYSNDPLGEQPESPRSYLRRVIHPEASSYHSVVAQLGRIDVDAEERRHHAYAPALPLSRGAMLIHPDRRSSTTCVLWLPGYARCFDHYATAAIFRERAGVDLVGLDLRHYGRSYTARCESGHIDHEWHNIPSTIFCLTDYFEDIEDALAALAALGYTSVVLWGCSTSGLTASSFLVRREERHLTDPATAERPSIIAIVLDAPLLAFRPGT